LKDQWSKYDRHLHDILQGGDIANIEARLGEERRLGMVHKIREHKNQSFVGKYKVTSARIAGYYDIPKRDQAHFMLLMKPLLERIEALRDSDRLGAYWAFPSRKECIEAWNKHRGRQELAYNGLEWVDGKGRKAGKTIDTSAFEGR
jgi:hypothetical protein